MSNFKPGEGKEGQQREYTHEERERDRERCIYNSTQSLIHFFNLLLFIIYFLHRGQDQQKEKRNLA